jgi:Lrp/AsnC family transcriptional regulator for asnA, asnC and gidA
VTDDMLDDTDTAIIEELYGAPRMAFREIARRVDVSEATVRTRVRRLEEAGILRFTAFVDPRGTGRGVLAVALLDVEPASHATVVATLTEWSEVVYLSTVFGQHSLQLQLSTANESELWRLVQATRQLPGVTAIQAQVEVEVHKIRYISPGKSS